MSSDKPKFTECHLGCGAKVQYRTTARVICPSCKPAHRAEQMRLVAERQRRKRGVATVKGTIGSCARCERDFVRRSFNHRFCADCRSIGVAESHKAARRRRFAKNPAFAINCRISNAIGLSIKGEKAGRKWEALVGYSLADLMAHLERQFLSGMTWENRGDWEIDHIVPLASFEFNCPEDEQFRAAWALTNLRPLWRGANRQKKAKRTHLI